MGTKDYRTKKIEYYGRPMGALNLYLYFLLPAFVVWKAILFTWHATVPSAQFGTVSEFLAELILLVLGAAALLSIYGVDRYAFFSNVAFLTAAGASRVIHTFFPSLLDGSTAASADLQPVFAQGAQAAQSLSGALAAFFASLGEGVSAAAAGAASMLADAGMGMSGSAAMGGMGMMGGAMGMMGDMGMAGGQAAGGSLIGKLVGIFVKTGEDFTLFADTVECGVFVLICLFFLSYFFANRRFFFSSLESFRARDEAA